MAVFMLGAIAILLISLTGSLFECFRYRKMSDTTLRNKMKRRGWTSPERMAQDIIRVLISYLLCLLFLLVGVAVLLCLVFSLTNNFFLGVGELAQTRQTLRALIGGLVILISGMTTPLFLLFAYVYQIKRFLQSSEPRMDDDNQKTTRG